jgi:uncharacterized glyoxalase superfamily protein PhnB
MPTAPFSGLLFILRPSRSFVTATLQAFRLSHTSTGSTSPTPPGQPDLEITLMAIDDKMLFSAESAATMRELVKAGTFGFAVFECDDMLATYEELKAKGVHFKKEPTKEFWGFNAVFKDDSGNWFSLGEAKKD